jgi:hypothetical protein
MVAAASLMDGSTMLLALDGEGCAGRIMRSTRGVAALTFDPRPLSFFCCGVRPANKLSSSCSGVARTSSDEEEEAAAVDITCCGGKAEAGADE